MTWQDNLNRLRACDEAVEWTQNYKTFPAAWKTCKRGDWMLWLAARSGVDRKVLVLAACACARTALKHVTKGEERPRVAIETAERWARGEATIEEVRAAAAAAAAASASAATTAYAYAASAATVYDAVYAAVYAAAAAAERTKSLSHSAGLVRKHITAAMIEEGWGKP